MMELVSGHPYHDLLQEIKQQQTMYKGDEQTHVSFSVLENANVTDTGPEKNANTQVVSSCT
jgi:hypothetical protein